MRAIAGTLGQRLDALQLPLAVVLPGGQRLGRADAAVTLRLAELSPLAHLATGRIGRLAEDHVEGRLEIEGSLRDAMDVAARLVPDDPTAPAGATTGPFAWLADLRRSWRSRARHAIERDAKQIEFHYDLSDDFYALWLDPRRVYSCAYFREPGLALAEAQEAKLDHICRKLRLREGERFLDIGAGWGGLLLWAAERYGVRATGITLSKNQHAHVNRRIAELGLGGRVSMQLLDYRRLDPADGFDAIASVGMFEHVGRAQMSGYFARIAGLLKPGGLVLNHGITAGGTANDQLGAGIGDFIERHIFPGGELVHVAHVLERTAEAGLEMLDTENLRPHYARTLWAWSDALEARLDAARRIAGDRAVRAYRLYLAGSAMAFERGWMALHQMLSARPSGRVEGGPMRGAQSSYPFQRDYMYQHR
jgi:cyclopropane-fatty-acyl-phospholipid synthase